MALSWLKKQPSGKGSKDLARLLAAQEDFSRLLQDTPDIVVFTHDCSGHILSVNRHGRWLSGLEDEFDARLPFLSLLHQPPSQLPTRLRELLDGRRTNFRHETALVRPGAEPLLLAWWHVPWHAGSDTAHLSLIHI